MRYEMWSWKTLEQLQNFRANQTKQNFDNLCHTLMEKDRDINDVLFDVFGDVFFFENVSARSAHLRQRLQRHEYLAECEALERQLPKSAGNLTCGSSSLINQSDQMCSTIILELSSCSTIVGFYDVRDENCKWNRAKVRREK